MYFHVCASLYILLLNYILGHMMLLYVLVSLHILYLWKCLSYVFLSFLTFAWASSSRYMCMIMCVHVCTHRWKDALHRSGHVTHTCRPREWTSVVSACLAPTPQAGFGEHSPHHTKCRYVFHPRCPFSPGQVVPRPGLSPQNLNLNRIIKRLCPEGTVSNSYSLDPEGAGAGASCQGHRSRNWHICKYLHNFPDVKFHDSGTILQSHILPIMKALPGIVV